MPPDDLHQADLEACPKTVSPVYDATYGTYKCNSWSQNRVAFRGATSDSDPSSNPGRSRATEISADFGSMGPESKQIGADHYPIHLKLHPSVLALPASPTSSTTASLIADLDALPPVAARPATRLAPKANPSHYATEAELREAFTRSDYARHLGFPLNTAITYLRPWHDDWTGGGKPALDLIEAIAGRLTDFFRHRRLPCVYMVKIENKLIGGAGLHLHMLLHIPIENYAGLAEALEKNLAQGFARKIEHRARRAGIWKPHKRMSAHKAYLALLDRKQSAKGHSDAARSAADCYKPLRSEDYVTIRDSLHDKARMARAISAMTSVPFMFSGKRCQPITGYQADNLSSYLTKDADPNIEVPVNGKTVRLGDIPRTDTGADWQEQSRRRPKMTLRSSANLHPQARQADPTWTEPAINLGERLIRSERTRIRRTAMMTALDHMHHATCPHGAPVRSDDTLRVIEEIKENSAINSICLDDKPDGICYNIVLEKST